MFPFLIPFLPLLGDAISALFGDDKPAGQVAATVANAAVSVASQIAGVPITDEASAQQAAQAIQADPAKLAEYQRALNEKALAAMKEETARLLITNETARAEIASSDPFVRRMRPTFGYAMALTWTVQMMAASYTIVMQPARAAEVLNGIAATTALWGIGLAVLGIYVNGRTKEKGAQGLGLPSIPIPSRKPAR